MRRYYIASGILLILPIINFAVAAAVPVLVQEKRQVGVDMAHWQLSEDATTILGKRGGDDLLKLIDNPEDPFANLEDFAANPDKWGPRPSRSSSSPPPLGPADGSPPPSTPGGPPTVPGQDHVPPSSGSLTESGEELNALPASDPAKSTISRLS